MTRRFKTLTSAIILCLLVVAFSFAGSPPAAEAAQGDGGFIEHTSIVPGEPQLGYPVILPTPYTADEKPRQTYAVDMVGRYIVSGGDFRRVRLQNGSVVESPYLAVVDSSTKRLVCEGLGVDGEVLAVAPGPYPESVVIGGRFSRLTGADGSSVNSPKLAIIRLDTCNVDPTFRSSGINGRVTELAVSEDRLFVGGDFTWINGKAIGHLAELDYSTGEVNAAFDFDFTPHPDFPGRRIVGLEANKSGTRLGVVHRANAIDGARMRGTAVFNISNKTNPKITAHRMSQDTVAHAAYFNIQDGAISPDFSYFAIAQGTDPQSAFVHKIPTIEAPGQFAWRHYMRNSSFGIAASNNAIYVAGHFCKIDGGPSRTAVMSPNTHRDCLGAAVSDNCALCNGKPSVWRSQLAALSPRDGTPLRWNPGVDALVGGRALTVTNRGLLVGFDGQFAHGAQTYRRVGTTVFFDLGAVRYPALDASCSVKINADKSWTVSLSPGTSGYTFWLFRGGQHVDMPIGDTVFRDRPGAGSHSYEIRPWDWHGEGRSVKCSLAGDRVPAFPAPLCFGKEATISGTVRDDVLIGTPGDDVIHARAGDDVVDGRGGNDLICGGGGSDLVRGGDGDDQMYGQDGSDSIYGGLGSDSLHGGDGRDRLQGGPGRDWLFGGPMIDALHGGTGNDDLYGEEGADRLNGNGGRDLIRGGSGPDRIQGGAGNDRILGGNDTDRCAGRKFGAPNAAGDSLRQCERR